ncbi:hypothetical protein AQ490_21525 [Wenjunlia vitaminophila]|uniref:Secreted protein n=1 Tax=Wenjunlia vitaminophila TaxID=76728 RepID=A0A0T6LTM2_WENVI|nr:hypothetical protein [Wenjunlia vitaminophila]KRV49186.1 hypothetical protein AQ490_21525 [Wenjunlia vitaminophila]
MNTGLKITAFAAALAATFGTAYGVGKATDPVVADDRPASHGDHASAGHDKTSHDKTSKDKATPRTSHPAGHGAQKAPPAGGLQISEGGYTLDLRTPQLRADQKAVLRFAIRDAEGRAVTAFQREHEKELHLILASRDLATFHHLHPTRAADGTWSTPVTLPDAGTYRVFADFTPDAPDATNLTLGADLAVSGAYRPRPLPTPNATAEVDGYRVALAGDLRPGRDTDLTLTVTKNGEPVTDLQPYLGAYGHLVALRSGDLAYLHVHPNGEPGDGDTAPGPDISFTTTAPSAGSYRLFLDFQHRGTVRTAAFTVRVPAAADHSAEQAPEPSDAPSPSTGGGHEH